MTSDRRGAPGRRRGPHAEDQQPRQGALPAHRHHQGRGAQLLRAGRAGAAAAPQGPGGDPDPLAARGGRQELLREEHPGRHAVVGAHREGADDRVAGQLAARRPPGVPDRRRPGHPDLAGQPGRPGAPRPPVDGQPHRPAAQPEPAGDRPRPRRAGRAAGVLRRRPAGARPARRARPRRPARSPAAARACTSTPPCRAGSTPRRRPGWPRRWPRSCRRSTRSWSPPP